MSERTTVTIARAAAAALLLALAACSSGGQRSDPSSPTAPGPATGEGESSAPVTVVAPTGDAQLRIERGTPQPAEDPGPVAAVVSAPASVARGRTATLMFLTRPGSTCQADVLMADGEASERLAPEVANGTGQVSWTWTVASDAKTGPATAYVSCSGGARGQSVVTIS